MFRDRVIGGAICAAASLFAPIMVIADTSMLPDAPTAAEAGLPGVEVKPAGIKLV